MTEDPDTGDDLHPLRAAREAVGLTRAELAHRVGCSARTVEAIERWERRRSPAMDEAFERALLRAALAKIADVEQAVAACARLDHATSDDGSGVRL
jgi:DNA-binding XRE family transcriptional regulator